jgi:tetratricopeptide (TPR) repeat protein
MPPSRAPSSDADAERAEELAGELSERERTWVTALNGINRASDQAITVLEQATARYPDDPDGWFLLGDALFHLAGQAREVEARAAFERALELAPGFGPAYTHLVDDALARGDTTGARVLVANFRDLQPEGVLLTALDDAVTEARAAGEQVVAEISPPDPASDTSDPLAPQRAQFQQLARTVGEVRDRAAQSLHPALSDRFGEAEGRREAAEAAASGQDYEPATSTLREARQLYEAIRRDNVTLQGIETARSSLETLRPDAQDPVLIAQASRAEQRANEAVAQGRYEDAVSELVQATDLLDRAAQLPEPVADRDEPEEDDGNEAPSRPQPPTSAEVTAQVLERLSGALEAEDLGRVRGVWTSISSEESQALEGLFSSVRDLSVTYTVSSIEERGSRLIATVQTNYSFIADQSGQPVSTDTGQVFEIQRSGSEWAIVASRSLGS